MEKMRTLIIDDNKGENRAKEEEGRRGRRWKRGEKRNKRKQAKKKILPLKVWKEEEETWDVCVIQQPVIRAQC